MFRLDVFAESSVDERLIAPAAGRVDLFAKPLQQIVVNSDRDSGLSSRRSQYRSAFPMGEITRSAATFFATRGAVRGASGVPLLSGADWYM